MFRVARASGFSRCSPRAERLTREMHQLDGSNSSKRFLRLLPRKTISMPSALAVSAHFYVSESAVAFSCQPNGEDHSLAVEVKLFGTHKQRLSEALRVRQQKNFFLSAD